MPGPNTPPKTVIASDAEITSISVVPSELTALQKCTNWRLLPDGSIETISGPVPLDPDRGQGYPTASFGYPHGIFHARLFNGMSSLLLLRAGSVLYRKASWSRTWTSIQSGLNSEERACFPDTFCLVNDRVIWCNGVDYPLQVDAWGEVYGLGFAEGPQVPVAVGPEQLADLDITKYPNVERCWPGLKGTGSDILSNQFGLLLAGRWYYYFVYEDYFGNLSPASQRSNAAAIQQITAEPYYANATADSCHRGELDQLTRQFQVTGPGSHNAVRDRIAAIRIYATRDVGSGRNPPTAYLVAVKGGSGAVNHPENMPDGLLSVEMPDNVGVEPYKVACVHNGILTVGNLVSNPMKIQETEPGFPGSWPKRSAAVLSGGGAELTGLVSHSGRRIAFTRGCTFDVTDLGAWRTIAQGIGCCAPRSLKATPDGILIWLSDAGYYAMGPDFAPRPISSESMLETQRGINYGFAVKAAADFDPSNREYLCAVAPAGESRNTRIWRYNGKGWKHYELGWSVAAMCVTDDERRYVLIAGADEDTGTTHVGVLHHESATYTAPDRTAVFRTDWVRPLELGHAFRVRDAFIMVFDGTDDTAIRVIGYKNDILAAATGPLAMQAMNPAYSTGIEDDIFGTGILGTMKLRNPRGLWRRVSLEMPDCFSFALGIECDYPNYARIGPIVINAEPVSRGGPHGRMPGLAETQ